MGGSGRFEEDALMLCKRFSFTVKHKATRLSVQRPFPQEGARHLCEVGFMGMMAFLLQCMAKIEYVEDRCK